MTIDDKITDKKLQRNINRAAANISTLSSSKIDRYQSLTGEEILRSNKNQMIEQAKFTCSHLEHVFERQTTPNFSKEKKPKLIEDIFQKSCNLLKPELIKDIFLKKLHNNEIKRELDKISTIEDK